MTELNAILGGWVIDVVEGKKLPQGVASLLGEARLGAKIEPLAQIATQQVNGKNYMILCKVTLATSPEVTTLSKIVVHSNGEEGGLGKHAIISNEAILALDITGGYTLDFAIGESLTEPLASAFTEVFEGMTGAVYAPKGYIGSQIVHGVNHMVLAKQTLVAAEEAEHLAMVEITQLEKDGKDFALRSISMIV